MHCWIGSDYPGAGKSYTAIAAARMEFEEHGRRTLVVTPLNKLNHEYALKGFEAVTPYTLLGIAPASSGRGERYSLVRGAMKVTGYTYILCDEWAAVPELLRMLFRSFLATNPHLVCWKMGDARQLPAIEAHVNFKGEAAGVERLKRSIAAETSRMLVLRVIKRQAAEADKVFVKTVHDATWLQPWDGDNQANVDRILGLLPADRVLTAVDAIPDKAAIITFHVNTAEALAAVMAARDQPEDAVLVGTKTLVSGKTPFYVWKGCILRANCNARTAGRAKDSVRLINNGRYEVVSTNAQRKHLKLVLADDASAEPFELGFSGVTKWFFHGAHVATGHSWQGGTVKDRPVVIADTTSPFVTRRWLWTALTRTDDFSRLFVLRPSVAEAAKHGFGNRDWKGFMSRAIAGYKRQDDAAARVWGEAAYATVDSWWALMREAGAACFHCGQSCDMMGDSTATLDRVVGSEAHTRDNVVLACLGCNQDRH